MSELRLSTFMFYVILYAAAAFCFAIQSTLFDQQVFGVLGGSYLMNVLLAALIYTVIIRLRKQHAEKLGFVFLIGSGLKFLCFFIFLNPIFKADGDLSNLEFATFFIPYALTTAIETIALVRELNHG
jgi:hypothetical protein